MEDQTASIPTQELFRKTQAQHGLEGHSEFIKWKWGNMLEQKLVYLFTRPLQTSGNVYGIPLLPF
jgi:hypothetical protein